ncbi:hypothetical protein B9L19_01955 [Geobacillus thermocatenulatus]|uniref:Uncharacterized protein n=1 Tax=Geobacillus thermocatenulatus TaxID=33938 RepID=A0A226QBI4_9BACL|nr:hypothetical protein GT3921_10040 [Geobacillus thermocatenulatus]OXB88890.1 hypothetical protein B9L19_01955 [Geobacillus thermocatenulatus]
MGKTREHIVGLRLVGAELCTFVRRKRSLLFFLLIGVYVLVSEINFLYGFGVNKSSLNSWQLIVAVLEGPSLHPPIFQIIGWLVLPTIFVLGMGEPFSFFQLQRVKILLSRIPTRWDYWWGRLIAWYVLGVLFVAFVLVISILLSGMVVSSDHWKIPRALILNQKTQPFQTVIIWSSFNLLTTIWWYITILVIFSMFFSHSGIATIVTLVAGCILTFIGANDEQFIPFLRPLLGAKLNGLSDNIIDSNSFMHLVYSSCAWFLLSIVGYVIFRCKDL